MSFEVWHPVVSLGLFTSDVWEFIVALWDHWEFALTGGVLAILSSWAGFHVRRSWGRWVFWSIAAVALVVASFGAWREKHSALVAEHSALVAERNALAAEHNERERAEEKYRRIIADLQKRPPTASPSKKEGPKLYITRPSIDNTKVGQTTAVSIKSDILPPNLYLWLLVHSPEGGDFAWGECPAKNFCRSLIPHPLTARVWDGTQEISIGGPGDAQFLPLRFTIRLVAVDQNDNDRLAKTVVNWSPIPSPVESAIPEDKRTVIRIK